MSKKRQVDQKIKALNKKLGYLSSADKRRRLELLEKNINNPTEYYQLPEEEVVLQKKSLIQLKIGNEKEVSNFDDKPSNKQEDDTNPLWVYEPEDLQTLAIKEVQTIWTNKENLCGSKEVAAEAIAILELDNGVVEEYLGWQYYLNHSELKNIQHSIFDETLDKGGMTKTSLVMKKSNDLPSKYKEVLISLKDIANLSLEELQSYWQQRDRVFESIEAACEALAHLRFKSGIDINCSSWESFLVNPEIIKLEDYLPSIPPIDKLTENRITTNVKRQHFGLSSELTVDKRAVNYSYKKARVGQQNFRKMVLKIYKSKCCITNCVETSLLEAAHIIPYMGEHSNNVLNGLVLRVDIHRLFDKFLISINPSNFKVVVAPSVQDTYYRSLAGKTLFENSSSPATDILIHHFKTYLKINKNRL